MFDKIIITPPADAPGTTTDGSGKEVLNRAEPDSDVRGCFPEEDRSSD